MFGVDQRDRLPAGASRQAGVADLPEEADARLEQIRLVLDDQGLGRHDEPFVSRPDDPVPLLHAAMDRHSFPHPIAEAGKAVQRATSR